MPHYLDPQQIFPKRMGIMHGNTLVLQYYDLARDRFKKHLMQFQTGQEPKNIVQKIYKDIKHVPYLKKVNPKNMRAVLEGNVVGFKKKDPSPSYNQFPEQRNYPQKYQSQKSYEVQKENFVQQNVYVPEKPKMEIFPPFTKPVEQEKPQPKPQPEPQPQPDYYNEDFQDFQISQSLEKGSFNSSFSKIDPANTKSLVSKNSESIIIDPPKKEEKKKKEVQPVQQPIEEVIQEFDFIDDSEKKKKKKDKSKGKSKEKKSKKTKEKKVEKKEESNTVEDDFDFL